MLESAQRFRSEKHIVFAEEVNKTFLNFNDEIHLHFEQECDLVWNLVWDLVCEIGETKCNNIIKQYKNG